MAAVGVQLRRCGGGLVLPEDMRAVPACRAANEGFESEGTFPKMTALLLWAVLSCWS